MLYYGSETINLTKQQINTIVRFENNLIRNIYGLPKWCRTKNLKLINNVQTGASKLKVIQIEFFERILSNNYTNQIIKDILTEYTDHDYINQILKILDEFTYYQDLNILDRCKHYKYINTVDHQTAIRNNPVLDELRTVFKKWNGDKQRLYELLRYDRCD